MGLCPGKEATMASNAVLLLTAANNISATSSEVADAVRKSDYYQTPRGRGEVRKILAAWGASAPHWAEVARLLLSVSPQAPQAPQAAKVAPQLTPDGGLMLNGRAFSARQIRFFMEVSAAYLHAKKEVGG